MAHQILLGKRVLITHAHAFMGPVLCEVFARHGATVIPNTDSLLSAEAPGTIVRAAGQVDILVANLALPAPTTAATDVSEDEWQATFAALVHPLPRLFRAVLPAMIERRSGKLLVMGSASALRGMKRASTYSAARGAQLAYVQAVGVEVAPHNVQVNAIAQNFVDNPTYTN
jgi:2-keto-3-deoxy-L-fuconate dehydrogenase